MGEGPEDQIKWDWSALQMLSVLLLSMIFVISEFWHGWSRGAIAGVALMIIWIVLGLLFWKEYGE